MEIKHLHIGNRFYSYATVFLNSDELEITFFDGPKKIKSVRAKILSHDATTGFLAFSLSGKVFQVTIATHEQTIAVQHRTGHTPILCKKIHAQPGEALTFFNTSAQDFEKSNDLVSPLSGRITQIFVKTGDIAKKGVALLIVESMKMENVLYASRDVVIKNVFITTGDLVKQNQRLIGFKRSGEVYGASQTTSEL